jgi:hypothetical protein
MQNLYVYIIAVVLLAIFLVYHEIKRANKKRLPLRILAVLVVSAALLFFIVPLKYHETQTTDLKAINILTAGVQPADLEKDVYYTTDSAVLKTMGKERVTYIPDLLYHLASHPEVNGVNVYGYGLAKEVLNNLQNKHVNFKPAKTPDGIISCSWPEILPEAEFLSVQGSYNNASTEAVKLLLEGLGTRLDSVIIPAKKQMTFNLSCQPRQTGAAVYQLLVIKDGKTTSSNDIPFQVTTRPKVKILVLAAAPDFEYKFLRNWLLDHKYSAFFRTRISKDKFSTEQVNLEVRESAALSAATFKKYDLVIADDEELTNLGSLNSALQRELNGGLGLLIRLNEAKALSNFTQAFKISGTADSITNSIIPVLGDAKRLKPVPVDQPLYISPNSRQLPLVKDPKGRILASTALRGSGRISVASLAATYNWVLSAATSDYATYWSALINQTSRKSSANFSWRSKPRLPLQGEQVDIIFQEAVGTNLPGVNLNARDLSVQQHLVLPFYWQASFRAEEPGWNTFSTSTGKKQIIYIYDSGAWQAVKANELLKVNTQFQKMQGHWQNEDEKTTRKLEKTVPKWIFFAFFLISMGFLWFETKILQ